MDVQLLMQQVAVQRPRVPYTPLSPASTTSPSSRNARRAFTADYTSSRPQRHCQNRRHEQEHLTVCSAVSAEAPPHTHGDGAVIQVPTDRIRNFSIIAHIDHGKSTLADQLLLKTGTVADRDMQAQFLDGMDLERERGITIKLNQARMKYTASDGQLYALNLIDTPGHVDFSYEVSRSLAACEGCLLVVDASQGVEAQTLANVYLALDHDLEIIPVLNKIDLPGADVDRVKREIEEVIGIDCSNAIYASAKQGIGIEQTLEEIVKRIPAPQDTAKKPLRALIFDSHYDSYKVLPVQGPVSIAIIVKHDEMSDTRCPSCPRSVHVITFHFEGNADWSTEPGVVVAFRVVDGILRKGDTVRLMNTKKEYQVDEVGVRAPTPIPVDELIAGEVGYLAASIKAVADARVGDTITLKKNQAEEALAGYQQVMPMVYCGLFPTDADQFETLREALGRLQLNDAALQYEPEVSSAMGFGFRCGFLGLLHMEIVQERLEREYDLDLIITAPTVVYRCKMTDGEEVTVDNPCNLPDAARREYITEPYVRMEIITPKEYVGTLMELCQARRGDFIDMQFLTETRTTIIYELPLATVVTDFFDELKSRSRGYASMEYKITGYKKSDLVRLDIKINAEAVDPLATICHREAAYRVGKALAAKLKELIPRQQFKVPIQAAIGARVVASESIPAMRKDVLAKCYGGDISRKKKLLKKQAAGKKRMKMFGKVEVPKEAFVSAIAINSDP